MSNNDRQVSPTEKRVMIAALAVGVLLLGLKFSAYLLTGSAAVFSDAMESIVNVAAGGMALYALMYAAQPADRRHPYGHGKIEFMSAGLEGGMVLAVLVAIMIKTIDTLLFHQIDLREIGAGLVIMAIAMVSNGAMGLVLIRVGRSRHSMVLQADGWHLMSDAVTSVATIIALGIVKLTGFIYADPIAAILVAGYVGWMALGLLRRAFGGLMDAQDVDDDRTIRRILDSHIGPAGREPRICSYHKLRHRHSGRFHWVEFHAVVPAGLTVRQGHEIASAIEYEIERKLGEGNATTHIEPCTDAGCGRCARGEGG